MAALTSPLPQFQSPFNVPAGTLPAARTGAEKSLLLAQQDPMFPKFLNTMRGNPKFSDLSDAAIANMFHLPRTRELLSGSIIYNDVPEIPRADMSFTRDAVDAQKEKAAKSPISSFDLTLGGEPILTIKDSNNLLGAFTAYRSGTPLSEAQNDAINASTDAEKIQAQEFLSKNPNAAQEPLMPKQIGVGPKPALLATDPTEATLMPNQIGVGPKPAALTSSDNNNNNNNGALFSKTANNAATAAQSYTGNQRGSNLPDMKIGRGERLMRMGLAGLAAGGLGGDKQLAAMGAAYADVNAENRAAEMAQFKIEEDRRAAEIRARAAGKTGASTASLDAGEQIGKMQMALTALKGGALTGVWDAGLKGWADKYGITDTFNEFTGLGEAGVGARRAYMRNILQGIKVDGALAYAAKTKGAISDAEMTLFLSPLPTQYQDEGVWIQLLEEKLKILQKIQGTASGGGTSGGTSGGASGGNQSAADKIVGI